jgi:hypothetical protein
VAIIAAMAIASHVKHNHVRPTSSIFRRLSRVKIEKDSRKNLDIRNRGQAVTAPIGSGKVLVLRSVPARREVLACFNPLWLMKSAVA